MATQTEQLKGIEDHVRTNVPEPIKQIIFSAVDELKGSFDPSGVSKPGEKFPDFTLNNAVNSPVSLKDLLASAEKGVLFTFYRGEWCPYCNIALSFLQKNLDDFKTRGVTVVAVSPELPNTSLTTVEKNALKYEVLSDAGNGVARRLGIVWKQFESLQEVSKAMGVDQAARNGDDSRELPVGTNVLVDKTGVIRNIYADPDWTKRLEPKVMLEWADNL